MRRRAYILAAVLVGGASAQNFPGMNRGSSGTATLTLAPPSAPNPTGLANRFRGAVPQGEASSGTMDLSLSEALKLGLDRNLGTLLSSTSERMARADRLTALSRLLPQVRAGVDENSQQMNLAAFGFPPNPAFPSVVGPFKVFDARAYVSQTLFNLRTLYDKRARSKEVEAAVLDSGDAKDTIAEVVTALYWNAVASASRIEAAQAQVTTAEASYQLAEDRRKSGLVPAIDALRAQVQLQAERQRLIASKTDFEKQKLSLAEAIGIPGAQALRLTDTLKFDVVNSLSAEEAILQAFGARKDYQSQAARVDAAELQRKGASRLRMPTVSVDGDYGTLGRSPITNNHGTYSVRLGVNIPIFSGGADQAALQRTEIEVDRQKTLLAEMRAHIGFEIRAALLDLNAAAEQVSVSRSGVDLAGQQVTQARDRFEAGVTDTMEVVQAQQGLAAANDSYITSLYAYSLAKVRLARAMGGTEQNLANWARGGGR